MTTVTEDGLIIRQRSAIVAELDQLFRSVYGDDISTAPDTPDGQMIGILAQMLYDVELVHFGIYQQLDPSSATSRWLDQRAVYANLNRKPGDSSVLPTVEITGDAGTEIPKDFVIEYQGVQWVADYGTAIGTTGVVALPFKSVKTGVFSVPLNSELIASKPRRGIKKIVSTKKTIDGRNREGDSALRYRLQARRLDYERNLAEDIADALLATDGVSDAIVHENFKKTTSPIGVEPNSIWAIVEGGTDNDVATTLYAEKGTGCGMQGSVSVFLKNAYAGDILINFSRPTAIKLEAVIRIGFMEGYNSVDTDAIVTAVTAKVYRIGDNVYHARVAQIAQDTQAGFYVDSITLAKEGQPHSTQNIVIATDERAIFTKCTVVLI